MSITPVDLWSTTQKYSAIRKLKATNLDMVKILIYLCYAMELFSDYFKYRRLRPLSRDFVSTFWPLFWGGRLNGRCYFSVKKSSHREKHFQCVSSRLDVSDLGPSLMQTDINRYFDLNSCSHGVKQIDDNYTCLYNENQYLYVELYDFCN